MKTSRIIAFIFLTLAAVYGQQSYAVIGAFLSGNPSCGSAIFREERKILMGDIENIILGLENAVQSLLFSFPSGTITVVIAHPQGIEPAALAIIERWVLVHRERVVLYRLIPT